MAFFTVVIPNYNHATFLKQRIDSILQQSIQDFEIIILDDASTDNSKEIIESYRRHPRVKQIFYNTKNTGSPFNQWKKGIILAESEWIWIAESDDVAMPDFLKTAKQALLQYPSAGIFYCNSWFESLNNTAPFKTTAEYCNALFINTKWSYDYFANGCEEINNFLSKYNIIPNASGAILHRSTLLPILNKLSAVNYMGDWLSYLQIASQKDVVYSCKPLNKFRRHPGSVFNNEMPTWKRKRDYFMIYVFLNKLFFLKRKPFKSFYVENYLDFGIYSDGFRNNIKTIKSYFKINPGLAIKVLVTIFLKKFKSQKKQIPPLICFLLTITKCIL